MCLCISLVLYPSHKVLELIISYITYYYRLSWLPKPVLYTNEYRLQKALSKIGAGGGAGDCKRGGLWCGCGVVEARSLSVLLPCLGVCATFLVGGGTTAPPRIVGLRLAIRASQTRDQLYRRIGSRQLLQWVVVGGNCRHGGPGPL